MIRIRAARPEDAAQIAAIYMPYVTSTAVSFEEAPPTAVQMRARMTKYDGLYPWLVATSENENAVLGYAYAARFRDRPAYRYIVETAIYLSGAAKWQSSGRLLYSALIETLTVQDFTQAVAVLSSPSEEIIALHESLGFRKGGAYREVGYKGDRWHDVGFWQRKLSDPEKPPLEPKPFHETGVVQLR